MPKGKPKKAERKGNHVSGISQKGGVQEAKKIAIIKTTLASISIFSFSFIFILSIKQYYMFPFKSESTPTIIPLEGGCLLLGGTVIQAYQSLMLRYLDRSFRDGAEVYEVG
jgi:hypothetical protein